MTIQHHPSEPLLTAFAAGMLDLGQHIAIATHLIGCPHCRSWVRLTEHVGGVVLASLAPSAMSNGALARIEARLNDSDQRARTEAKPVPTTLDDVPGLPAFVRRYRSGPWTRIAPHIYLRPIMMPEASSTRVFLLKSSSGTKMLEHSHTKMEMTCVLSGSFSHEGGYYGPGDFDLGDDTIDHKVMIGPEEDCICLIAMQGKLRLNGLLGRLMQPFIRM